MTAPRFEWKGDSPESTEGSATFVVEGLSHSMRFRNFADAYLLADLIQKAYNQGLGAGRRALAQLVTGAVERYR